MSSQQANDRGPDLAQGVSLTDFGSRRMLRGYVGDDEVLLARVGDDVVAVGATCTHYGGPLDEGLLVGETVRCPWHHACFSLRTGEAVGAPAIDPVDSWRTERDGDRIVVRERADETGAAVSAGRDGRPDNVVIVGGGAAGFACAEMLRRTGYAGGLRILSADTDAPYDRPKLSKQFLAGAADRGDLPMRPDGYYAEADIDLRLRTEVTSIDTGRRTVTDGAGRSHDYDCLVLATGAEPVQLDIPGADLDHVFTLRSAADSEAILARAEKAERAVVIGSGFIGLEVCASLAKHDVAVDVISRDSLPLVKILGEPLGRRVRAEHEKHGATFHTETEASRIERGKVMLDDGTELDADLVILGVGVKPRVELAEAAGLAVDDGVVVDECLRTSAAGIYSVGDIARWHDGRTDRDLRVEHWVVAQRHGQHVARNILDGDSPFTDVPFFWSGHHDVKIRYAGHAEDWDAMDIDGDVDALDCTIGYRRGDETLAVATVGRDLASLDWEAKQEELAGALPS